MSGAANFREMTIGRKLLLAGLVSSGVAIVLLVGLMITRETLDLRGRIVSDLATEAAIVGMTSAPALVFDDRKAATDALTVLKATPAADSGGIYDKNGDLFAEFGRQYPRRLPSGLAAGVSRFTADGLINSTPIVLNNERLGTVYLQLSLDDFYRDLWTGGALIVAAGFASFLAGAFFINRLQKRIVHPIVELSSVMQDVSQSRDYSVRVTPRNRDEVGSLAKAFNGMLEAVQDRDASLAEHQAELETTVAERTAELKKSNVLLERELVDRKAAQETLREHDALLKSVTRSAAGLLGSMNIDDAIPVVLELIAQTITVTRVQLNEIGTDRDGHLRSTLRYEWFAPGMARLLDIPALQNLDLSASFPKIIAPMLVGEDVAVTIDDISSGHRGVFDKMEMHSLLMIPVLIESKLWGSLSFIDSSPKKRLWSWAETDTLKTLAGLIGVAIARARR